MVEWTPLQEALTSRLRKEGLYFTSQGRGKKHVRDAAQPPLPIKGAWRVGENKFPLKCKGFPTTNPEPTRPQRMASRVGEERDHEMRNTQLPHRGILYFGNKTSSMFHGVWSYFCCTKFSIS